MIAILVIVLITLTAGAFTVFGLWHAPRGKNQERVLPPPDARGLFSDPTSEDDADGSINKNFVNASTGGAELIERARQGDMGALSDAQATGDVELYNEALGALIERACERQESLSPLVSHIIKSNELRANTELAERVLEGWKAAPDRRSTIEMLHIAALSDDAATYQKAVEEALGSWHGGRLTGILAEELLALVESEYWILASEARMGGTGFALKQMLADARRKLAGATPAR
jgi:hypothetical protein